MPTLPTKLHFPLGVPAAVEALNSRAGSLSIPVKCLCLPSCESSGGPAHPHPSGTFLPPPPPALRWHSHCQDGQALPRGPCLDPGTPHLHCPRTGSGSKSSGWNKIWQQEVDQQNGPGPGAAEAGLPRVWCVQPRQPLSVPSLGP